MARFVANPWLRLVVFLAILTAGVTYAVGSWEAFQQSRVGNSATTSASGGPARGAWPLPALLGAADPAKGQPGTAGSAPGAQPGGQAGQAGGQAGGQAAGAGRVIAGENGDFFAEFRLNRERARGQELELLQVALGNLAVTEAARSDAQTRFLRLGRIGVLEAELENLLRARGFADALVYVSDQSAQVVVKGSVLTPGQLAAVADLVRITASVKAEAVQVVARER